MKILFCGDVVGRSGREAFTSIVPELKERLSLDAVIVNAENAAHGFGITPKLCRQFYSYGADVITTGNHVWDQKEIFSFLDTDPHIVRPANFPKGTPGKGHIIFETTKGKRLLVMQVMGRLFMDPLDDPFAVADSAFSKFLLGKNIDAVVVDIHGEATSEKMAFGHFLDGRVSLVAGTHSHIPTADLQVLPNGTSYITDLGMCGDYDSVIGMKKKESVSRFVRKIKNERFAPAEGEATMCGVYVETDDSTGLTLRTEMIRMGGRLKQSCPL